MIFVVTDVEDERVVLVEGKDEADARRVYAESIDLSVEEMDECEVWPGFVRLDEFMVALREFGTCEIASW